MPTVNGLQLHKINSNYSAEPKHSSENSGAKAQSSLLPLNQDVIKFNDEARSRERQIVGEWKSGDNAFLLSLSDGGKPFVERAQRLATLSDVITRGDLSVGPVHHKALADTAWKFEGKLAGKPAIKASLTRLRGLELRKAHIRKANSNRRAAAPLTINQTATRETKKLAALIKRGVDYKGKQPLSAHAYVDLLTNPALSAQKKIEFAHALEFAVFSGHIPVDEHVQEQIVEHCRSLVDDRVGSAAMRAKLALSLLVDATDEMDIGHLAGLVWEAKLLAGRVDVTGEDSAKLKNAIAELGKKAPES